MTRTLRSRHSPVGCHSRPGSAEQHPERFRHMTRACLVLAHEGWDHHERRSRGGAR